MLSHVKTRPSPFVGFFLLTSSSCYLILDSPFWSRSCYLTTHTFIWMLFYWSNICSCIFLCFAGMTSRRWLDGRGVSSGGARKRTHQQRHASLFEHVYPILLNVALYFMVYKHACYLILWIVCRLPLYLCSLVPYLLLLSVDLYGIPG